MRWPVIDLNCDLGEGGGCDEKLMPWVSSVNVACGAHAGDEASMRATVRLARARGVAVGAHPGFYDRAHFGRRELALGHQAIKDLVRVQVGRLLCIAQEESVPVVHVKPHGALYNQAARDADVAEAIAEGVAELDPRLLLFGLAGSRLLNAGRSKGLTVVSEVFADRSYRADGSLTPRDLPGAVLGDVQAVTLQVLGMMNNGLAPTVEGGWLQLEVGTVCIHGDGPHALEFTSGLRMAIERAGGRIAAPGA